MLVMAMERRTVTSVRSSFWLAVCSQHGYLSSRGGGPNRWHPLDNCDHGDSTTSRFDSPSRCAVCGCCCHRRRRRRRRAPSGGYRHRAKQPAPPPIVSTHPPPPADAAAAGVSGLPACRSWPGVTARTASSRAGGARRPPLRASPRPRPLRRVSSWTRRASSRQISGAAPQHPGLSRRCRGSESPPRR
jgi:hypothetical protein